MSDPVQENCRISACRKLLRTHRVSHILVSGPTDVEYLSGFHSTCAFLLVSQRRNVLFTDSRYREAAVGFVAKRPEWWFAEIRDGNFAVLRKYIRSGSTVGIQSDIVTVDQSGLLRKSLRGVRFAKLGKEVAELTHVKLPRELRAMRRAADIGDRALAALRDKLQPGMTERAAARGLDELCRSMGADGPSFDTIVLFGAHSALPHGVPGNRRLRTGDWILCDFGCVVDGFCSDMTRTLVMGHAGERKKQVYRIVREAQRCGRHAVRAGVAANEVDKQVRNVIDGEGLGKAFGHATGHGLGRRVHEGPRVSRTDTTTLKKNMVVTIEPGVYIKRFGGVRIEDMLLVTDSGCRCLTRSPRELIEV